MTTLRKAAQQALEALEANQYAVADQAPHGDVMAYNAAITALRAALAQQAEPVAADALTEPKSGDKWRVEWWNESCRMMLPAHAKLDSFVAYKNGTIQFTIKRTAA